MRLNAVAQHPAAATTSDARAAAASQLRAPGEYRAVLDAEREARLARGRNHQDLAEKLKDSKKSKKRK